MEERKQVPAYEDCLDYTPTARSVSLARRRAAALVTAWGHPELAGDAALLVSELATNALLHGCLRDRLFRVHLMLGATALRIEVTDPRGESTPRPRTPADDEQFGRGLLLVGALADRWGIEPRTVGKTVYAELAIRPGAGYAARDTAGAKVDLLAPEATRSCYSTNLNNPWHGRN